MSKAGQDNATAFKHSDNPAWPSDYAWGDGTVSTREDAAATASDIAARNQRHMDYSLACTICKVLDDALPPVLDRETWWKRREAIEFAIYASRLPYHVRREMKLT